jgi:DNA-binding MarR family transcriptional regulator
MENMYTTTTSTHQHRMIQRADVQYLRLEVLRSIKRLRSDKKGVSYEQIADELGCGRVTVWRHIKALKENNLIETSTDKKPVLYTLTPTGELAVNGSNHSKQQR